MNECLVSGIEENDRIILLGVLHPSLELLASRDSTGGVVRKAEVDDVGFLGGHIGDEAVGRIALEIKQAGVGAFFIGIAGVAGHDIGVDIDRVNRIGDGDGVAVPEDIENVAGVAF